MGKRIARAGLAGFLIGILVLGLGGLVWVAFWLLLTRGARLAVATPPRLRQDETGLSERAKRGFLTVVVLAVLTLAASMLKHGAQEH